MVLREHLRGYLAWAVTGQTQQRVGPVEWKDGAFRAHAFEVGRFYSGRNHMAFFEVDAGAAARGAGRAHRELAGIPGALPVDDAGRADQDAVEAEHDALVDIRGCGGHDEGSPGLRRGLGSAARPMRP
jgi:hypothetical protein